MGELGRQASGSVWWSAVERFSVQGVQYLLTIILARLLLPSDYGLVAMLWVFVSISQTFIDGGLGNALIQKKNRTATDYSTVFCFNIILSLLLYLLLFLAAPYIASFYGEPALNQVTKVAGLVLIINSLGIVQQAKLTVELDFKRQAAAALTAVILSGVLGTVMAYHGWGVWALVWYTLLNNGLRVVMLWIFARWKPSLAFSKESFRGLFSFGSKLLLSSLLHSIYLNLYTLVIGKKFAAAELGYYNRASTLAQFPSTNLTNVIVRAVYPIQCRMQDDEQELNRLFLVYLKISCYLIFPLMTVLCALADPLTRFLLTDKWMPAVPLFQILCIAFMWDPVMKINHNMLNVKGRSDYFLKAELLKKAAAVVILVGTIPLGIKAMCIGLVVYSFVDMAVIISYSKKLTTIGFRKQIRALTPIILLSAASGSIAYLAMHLASAPLWQLLIGGGASLFFFILASLIFRFPEFRQLLNVIRRR